MAGNVELNSNRGWIGVDLDGTLALYNGWQGIDHIGEPIKLMLNRVLQWVDDGIEVRIMTARSFPSDTSDEAIRHIKAWCLEHIGTELEVTYMKDYNMVELWDDRAVQVIPNTGIRADGLR